MKPADLDLHCLFYKGLEFENLCSKCTDQVEHGNKNIACILQGEKSVENDLLDPRTGIHWIMKPADLVLHCSQKRVLNFEKVVCIHWKHLGNHKKCFHEEIIKK